MNIIKKLVGDLVFDPSNVRLHPEKNLRAIKGSLVKFGQQKPIVIDKKDVVIAGNGTLAAAKELGWTHLNCVVSTLDAVSQTAFAIADNRTAELAEWDDVALQETLASLKLEDFDIEDIGFDQLDNDDDPYKKDASEKQSLSETFGVPPFSVLNARQGYWQDRKKTWFAMGVGRDNGRTEKELVYATNLLQSSNAMKTGTSVFDPVLCEVLIAWYSGGQGKILDPFAGGSVRGLISGSLGRHYTGIDVRQEQIASNLEALEAFEGGLKQTPTWVQGDSLQVLDSIDDSSFDMILSCPPYGCLEKYSDDPNDISNMTQSQFEIVYRDIIIKTCQKLKNDRFAAWVIGDYRLKDGNLADFVSLSIACFKDAGLALYNEAILATSIGSVMLRARKIMTSRKLAKIHQNILIFVKGDWKKAAKSCGDLVLADFSEEED